MKKKSRSTEEALATNQDLDEWGNVLVDRINSLDARMDSFDGRMDSLDARMDSFDGRTDSLEKKIVDSKDEILTKIDGFIKRVSDLDEENAAGTLQARRLNSKVDNHEKRLVILETKN